MPSSTFRKESAPPARLPGQEAAAHIEITPPWGKMLFGLFATLFLLGLGVTVFGRVDVHARGRGIFKPTIGVRTLQAQMNGILLRTFAKNGDYLVAGSPIAEFSAADQEASLLETEHQIGLLDAMGKASEGIDTRLQTEQTAAIQARVMFLEQQSQSAQNSVNIQKRRLDTTQTLEQKGLLPRSALDDAQDQLDQIKRQWESIRQSLAQTEQELAALRAQKERLALQRRQEIQNARIRQDALKMTLQQTILRAPVNGHLEALVAKIGETVRVGEPLAKLIPANSALEVVGFVREKDRPFLKPGDNVFLELEAYPYVEFGVLEGTLVRISQDLASQYEVMEAFGQGGPLPDPSYRVEIALSSRRPRTLDSLVVRPGMLVQVRYRVRRQRLLAVLFTPLGRWLH